MGWREPASFDGRSSFRSQEGVSNSSPWGCNVRIGDGRWERLEGEIPTKEAVSVSRWFL